MRDDRLRIKAHAAFLSAALMASIVGCSSAPTGPDPEQKWLTIAEYKLEGASQPFLLDPVIIVPAGTEVELRIGNRPNRFFRKAADATDKRLRDVLEPVESASVIRLKAKKTVYLDLRHMLVSTNKEEWTPLSLHFFPNLRETHLALTGDGEGSSVAIPLWSLTDAHLLRDPLSHPK